MLVLCPIRPTIIAVMRSIYEKPTNHATDAKTIPLLNFGPLSPDSLRIDLAIRIHLTSILQSIYIIEFNRFEWITQLAALCDSGKT